MTIKKTRTLIYFSAVSILSFFTFLKPSLAIKTNLGNGVTVDFTETPNDFTAIFTGEIVNTNSNINFPMGDFWKGNIKILIQNEDKPAGIDIIIFTYFDVYHNIGPHSDDGKSSSIIFGTLGTGGTGSGLKKTIGEINTSETIHPNGHKDIWTTQLVAAEVTGNQINSWGYKISAVHVPEPSTLSAIVVTGAIGFWLKLKQKLLQ